jgi:hypothetical protein
MTQREWRKRLVDARRKHPIAVGDLYRNAVRLPSLGTLSAVAAHFGVSVASVSHHVALVTRLPAGFVEWYRETDDPEVRAVLTERRLRPIARLDPGAQEDRLRELLQAPAIRRVST